MSFLIEPFKNHPKPWIYLASSMYLAGLIGLNIPSAQEFFQFLTPFHLLSSLLMLAYWHSEWSRQFTATALLIFLLGYGVEVLGVHTGLIFGSYQYETTLGWKVFDVPLLIGVNWLILVYCQADLLRRWNLSSVSTWLSFGIKSVVGAIGLTLLDYIVEPVAIKQAMWSWTAGEPPLHNFIGWLWVSFLMMAIFQRVPLKKINPLAPWILGLQWAFFGLQAFN